MKKIVVTKTEAPWCSACRLMAPAWAKIVKEFGDRAEFHIVDTETDTGRSFAIAHGVMSLPTVVYQQVDAKTGTLETLGNVNGVSTYAQMKKKIESLLS